MYSSRPLVSICCVRLSTIRAQSLQSLFIDAKSGIPWPFRSRSHAWRRLRRRFLLRSHQVMSGEGLRVRVWDDLYVQLPHGVWTTITVFLDKRSTLPVGYSQPPHRKTQFIGGWSSFHHLSISCSRAWNLDDDLFFGCYSFAIFYRAHRPGISHQMCEEALK